MTRIYTIIILIALLCLGGGTITILYKKWRAAEEQVKNMVALNGKKFKELEVYKNKYNEIVYKNEAVELESKSVKKLVKNDQLKELKSFDKPLKNNFNNLKSATTLKIEIPLNSTSTFIKPDSTFNIDNGSGRIAHTEKGFQIFIDDTIKTSLTVINYWHRKWFLGAKKWNSEATSSNKKLIITELKTIVVKK